VLEKNDKDLKRILFGKKQASIANEKARSFRLSLSGLSNYSSSSSERDLSGRRVFWKLLTHMKP